MEQSFEKQIIELKKTLEKLLPQKRYEHSLSVAYFAASVAMCYRLDEKKAMLAGLLHDCAKYLSDKELLKECEKKHLPISQTEQENPSLLHAKLGAYYAKHKYQIQDKQILSAIAYHTTGRPAMTMLEQIIFLADYLELFRTQETSPSLSILRSMVFWDINLTTYLVLKNTVEYLQNKKAAIDQTTIVTLEYYEKRIHQKEEEEE